MATRGRPKRSTHIKAPEILLKPAEQPMPTYWKGVGLLNLEVDDARKAEYDAAVSKMVDDRWAAALTVFDLTSLDFDNGPHHVARAIFRILFEGFELKQPGTLKSSPRRWTPSDPATVRCYARALQLRFDGLGKLKAWELAAREIMSAAPAKGSLRSRWTDFIDWPFVETCENYARRGPDGIQYVLTEIIPGWLFGLDNPSLLGSNHLTSPRLGREKPNE